MNIEFKKVCYVFTRGTYDKTRYSMNAERPGTFKKHDHVTGVHKVGGARVMLSLNGKNDHELSDHFLAGVYVHAVFEQIHPFADGNGRAGRTLMNDYFMIHDIAPTMIYHENKHKHCKPLEHLMSMRT